MDVAAWTARIAARFREAGIHFGHGTDNADDEAAWLVLHVTGGLHREMDADGARKVSKAEAQSISDLAHERIRSRRPLAYLLGTAWFAGLEFEVSDEVLVPRSPFAELIADGFQPWLGQRESHRILDMCTGSGCIAVATALRFPQASIDAADLSAAALAVASRNTDRHDVADRVRLIESNLFQSLPGQRYDLILANPPYVPEAELAALPAEYRREPGLGLVSGHDGLDLPLRLLAAASDHLTEQGLLFCEVGESAARLQEALPRLPFLWLEFAAGGEGVFALERDQLEDSLADVRRLIEERSNVR